MLTLDKLTGTISSSLPSSNKKYYAGIGSRGTSFSICHLMTKIAECMELEGWVLRSGGAAGADRAFEAGVRNSRNKQIFLSSDVDEAALDIACRFHPLGQRLRRINPFVRNLLVRNTYQVLGRDLNTPSELVICWTPGAMSGGGTGQAIRIANGYGIPVHDLANPKWERHYQEKIGL